jgi:hypothetical protein
MTNPAPQALLIALAILCCPSAPAQSRRLVTGVISYTSNSIDEKLTGVRKLTLVLDRDGYPGQKRGSELKFVLTKSTRITYRGGKELTADEIRQRQQANVFYEEPKPGTYVVSELQLLEILPPGVPLPGSRAPAGSPSNPSGATNSSRSGSPASRDDRTVSADASAKVSEVRLQKSARQGDANIETVQSDASLYVAFYVRVDATQPVRLRYRCGTVDFERIAKQGVQRGENLKWLAPCDFEETVPAGFHGVRYQAFRIHPAAPKGGKLGTVIAGEVAPILDTKAGQIIAWQRKLCPLTIYN